MAAGCWLLAVGCWLLAVGCWLLAVGCWLLAAGCWLLAVGCWLLAVGCWLLTVGCWLLAVGSRDILGFLRCCRGFRFRSEDGVEDEGAGILLPIVLESLEDGESHFVEVGIVVHILLFGWCGDVSEFHQTCGQCGKSEYGEVILLDASGSSDGFEPVCDAPGYFHAVLHILVEHHIEEDGAFRRVGVEASVVLFVVVLEQDDGVLALCGTEFLVASPHALRVDFDAGNGFLAGYGVDVDGYEQVGMVSVGDGSPLFEFYEHVFFSGVHHLHIRAVGLDIFPEV